MNTRWRNAIGVLLVSLLLCGGTFTSARPPDKPLIEAHYVMGTIFQITLYTSNREAGQRAMRAAFEEIRRIDAMMSNYKPESELSRMNRTAWERPFHASDELYAIIRESISYAELTDGAFDVTVAPLLKLWGFYKHKGHFPTTRELERVRARVGYALLILDDEKKTISFAKPGVEVDLGGIAKGYAIDRAVEILRRYGITSALLSAGESTIYALGAPPGKAFWSVSLRDPKHPQKMMAVLRLRDQSVSTSGRYEKFFRLNGKVYGHIFDPRTGRPVQGIYSVTVVAPRATQSDALSTSVFVLGFERGITLLDRLDDVTGLIVGEGNDGEAYHIERSEGFDRILQKMTLNRSN